MKINRTFSIDIDAVEKLKEVDNASELVSNLILQHFAKEDNFINSMTKEELATFIELERKKEEATNKIEEFKNGNNQ